MNQSRPHHASTLLVLTVCPRCGIFVKFYDSWNSDLDSPLRATSAVDLSLEMDPISSFPVDDTCWYCYWPGGAAAAALSSRVVRSPSSVLVQLVGLVDDYTSLKKSNLLMSNFLWTTFKHVHCWSIHIFLRETVPTVDNALWKELYRRAS